MDKGFTWNIHDSEVFQALSRKPSGADNGPTPK